MPNPPPPGGRRKGNCFSCDAFGGPELFGATHCLRPADSGKAVSRMPESGCNAWRPVDRSTWTARFVARGLQLDPRLAGDDCAEAADDLIDADPEVLLASPERAAEIYYGAVSAS